MPLSTTSEPGETARQPLRCLVVEDQTMFLQLLVGMLRTVPGIDVVATAATVHDGIACCRAAPIDLLILDLILPDGDGIDVLREAVAVHPSVACIVLSSAAGECSCPRELLGNLEAVIDKAQAYERLQTVIADRVRSQGLAGPGSRGTGVEPAQVLRPRELEVFQLLGRGLTTAEIADRLGISTHTVETHRRNIVARLGVRGAELVRLATIHNQTSLGPVGIVHGEPRPRS